MHSLHIFHYFCNACAKFIATYISGVMRNSLTVVHAISYVRAKQNSTEHATMGLANEYVRRTCQRTMYTYTV